MLQYHEIGVEMELELSHCLKCARVLSNKIRDTNFIQKINNDQQTNIFFTIITEHLNSKYFGIVLASDYSFRLSLVKLTMFHDMFVRQSPHKYQSIKKLNKK